MSTSNAFVAALVAATALTLPITGLAANPNDPALDPSQRDKQLRLDADRFQDKQVDTAPAPAVTQDSTTTTEATDNSPSFTLESIRFTPSQYLTKEQLEKTVSPWLGQSIHFADIEKIVAAVNALYREQGVYTATAILPKQRIEEGTVLIRLVEGSLGKLLVENNQYTQSDYVKNWIHHKEGEKTVDVKQLESDIMLYNRTNDQRLQAELRAGDSFGLTDIVVRVAEPERNNVQVFLDNYGYDTTGKEELGALYRRQALLTDGDRGLFYGQVSKGTRAFSTTYNAPVGKQGWRVGGSASYTLTEVVNGDFTIADVEGQSYRFGLEASKLLLSKQKYWATLLLSASRVDSETNIARGAALSKNIIDSVQGGVQLNWLGSKWQFTFREMLNAIAVDDQLLLADKNVLLHEGSLTSIYQISSGFYGLFQSGWQLTNKTGLPGTVSYSLGGVYTARGYQPGIISGDKGQNGQLELHYNNWKPAGQPLDMFAFYDIGSVKTTAGSQNLQSIGVGASATVAKRLSVDATIGHALKDVTPNQDDWMAYLRLTYKCL